ncbi:hypothetical protein GQ44DRAFT_721947 [Phaeosphaeriaceae sp. PMI808]|nr:hypothetical protein GQ44DRAFT_721947 [Phaeosphaeriaceae sp. PMI808]
MKEFILMEVSTTDRAPTSKRPIRTRFQVNDLLGSDCAVPTHDPVTRKPQPRSTISHSFRKHVLNSTLRIPLRPIQTISGVASSNGTFGSITQPLSPPAQQLNDITRSSDVACKYQLHPHISGDNKPVTREITQPESLQVTTKVDTNRLPKERLMFWRRVRSQDLGPIEAQNIVRPSKINIESAPPSGIIASDLAPIVATKNGPVLTATENRTMKITDFSEAEASTLCHVLPHIASAVMPNQHVPAPSVSRIQEESDPANCISKSINSTKVYSPEVGVFVGKLYNLPPPEELQMEWRQTIRPHLLKNLLTVIASLPPSLSRIETTIEPELCMSGKVLPGHLTVLLKPTIWLRCGSKPCQKAVQIAVEDIGHILRFPVHVTQFPPRPASGSRMGSCEISRDSEHTSEDMIDEITLVQPTVPVALSNIASGSQINIPQGKIVPNIYWTSSGSQVVDRTSGDLEGRAVKLLCHPEGVREGHLLSGDSCIIDKSGYWETKKIQLDDPLGLGASGTWVVESGALIGIVTAAYDNEPYAHMIPIASVFSDIEKIYSKILKSLQ